MFDAFINFYTGLPFLVRETLYVVGVVMFARRYLAKDIETELDKRGMFKDGLMHTIIRVLKQGLQRQAVIWTHYSHNHQPQLTECREEQCITLETRSNIPQAV